MGNTVSAITHKWLRIFLYLQEQSTTTLMHSVKHDSVFSNIFCFMPTLGAGRSEPGRRGKEAVFGLARWSLPFTILGVASGGDHRPWQ